MFGIKAWALVAILLALIAVGGWLAMHRIERLQQSIGKYQQAEAQLKLALGDQQRQLDKSLAAQVAASAARLAASNRARHIRQQWQADKRDWQAKLSAQDKRWMAQQLPANIRQRMQALTQAKGEGDEANAAHQ